ncbi:YifB family Mg chelatase-like AAA ATPase [Lederbergia citrea]|uniref:YifB family Mg chelatase-like AAA ATPase n=1 Tax=Lederbergia citrea TaxID=2833581 RepID=A0A942Z454_9BACI|nr:YifB family Mg chelatase-like AAA ATPase [Lederbergia citrea]MBS4178183.1 YifB family Mg chelatase-like AAA ATPase [Lederbergia citrea]MBS4223289.1 YifB family Mg chelatase-like AAA ATPase [Lederbergia citrea]
MTVKVSAVGLKGLEGYKIQVEVQSFSGLHSMVIVGLPDASVKESRERVLSVLRHLDCNVAAQKIVVNLSPSEQRKNGPLIDLAIAIGILREMQYIYNEIPPDLAFVGALSLDGTVVPADGMLPAVLAAKSLGFSQVFIPYDPSIPLHLIEGVELIVVNHVKDVMDYLCGKRVPPFTTDKLIDAQESRPDNIWRRDFSHVIGQKQAKRAMEIAAAGEHNILLSGPPGCGKSLLAETFPSILPSLSKTTQLEVMSLYQLAGEKHVLDLTPPYRNPHHSASSIALIGGGSQPKPGEISLAHKGVLFLDEMAEFSKKTLEMLRQPLESGKVTISRVDSKVMYPTSFILIGATNPCPCGYLGSANHYCTCSEKQIRNYHNRISGPVYERIDILISMKSISLDIPEGPRETSAEIQERTAQARNRQYLRYQKEISNGKVSFEQLMEASPISDSQQKMLTRVSANQHWSNRVQIKIIRLARTISDLAGDDRITDEAIWEAMTLRRVNFQQQFLAARDY